VTSGVMSGERLWQPSAKLLREARVTAFRALVNERHALDLSDFHALHAWSIAEREAFWVALWDFAEVRAEQRGDRVLIDDTMPGARWFPDARLNFAENLLHGDGLRGDGRRGADETPAIIACGEDGAMRSLSFDQLRREVDALAAWLADQGVGVGDRVAGFVANVPEAVVAMLATASLGAVWSSCSPDFGIEGVHDRFGQIRPKVLIAVDGYRYAGRVHDVSDTVGELVERLDSLVGVVIVPFAGDGRPGGRAVGMSCEWGAALVAGRQALAAQGIARLEPPMLPFDHPLYILYSSGTTGQPKCIVHGAGGTLLQHLKEHQLHADVRPGDKVFFFTTCGWMMWNWLVTGLAAGATIVLYDGSPFHPDGNTLFDLAESVGVTQFGTSAKFIDACAKASIAPAQTHRLEHLRSVLSTGSPLVPESFDYVYEHIGADLCLSSMSGGTDIVSCFSLGASVLPVHRGELQCLGLGMDVQVYDDQGQPLPAGEKGELVCAQAFPSMPIGFLDDPGDARYRRAYFERYDVPAEQAVWCHGDFVSRTAHGGLIIHGRSDAVLNPGGVRIGTAEIYRPVETFDEVLEAIVIGQRWQGDVRVVLFVRLREGMSLDDTLRDRIKSRVRERATPRHVPARIVQVSDIPRTRSGKLVELAVARCVHGEAIDNREALANPEALDLFADLPELDV